MYPCIPLSVKSLRDRDGAANYSRGFTYRNLALNNNILCLLFLNLHCIICSSSDNYPDKDWLFTALKKKNASDGK